MTSRCGHFELKQMPFCILGAPATAKLSLVSGGRTLFLAMTTCGALPLIGGVKHAV